MNKNLNRKCLLQSSLAFRNASSHGLILRHRIDPGGQIVATRN
jgi:hypothetical protein